MNKKMKFSQSQQKIVDRIVTRSVNGAMDNLLLKSFPLPYFKTPAHIKTPAYRKTYKKLTEGIINTYKNKVVVGVGTTISSSASIPSFGYMPPKVSLFKTRDKKIQQGDLITVDKDGYARRYFRYC